METLQTVGQKIHSGLTLNIVVKESLDFGALRGYEVLQLLYIEEGTVLINAASDKLHFHPPLLLCLDHSKDMDHVEIVDGKGFSIIFKPDVIHTVLSGEESSSAVDGGMKENTFLVEPFLRSSKSNPVYLQADVNMQKRIQDLKRNLLAQIEQQPDPYWPCRGRSFFLELMILVQSFVDDTVAAKHALAFPHGSEALSEVCRYIVLNYSNSRLSIGLVAKDLGMKAQALKKEFVLANETFKAFLTRLRSNIAANLVRNTLLPFDVIQTRTGYPSKSSMTRDFKKTEGMSPEMYRATMPVPYSKASLSKMI